MHFSGIVWFRLPLDNDSRAWSLSTLAAVICHQPLTTLWQWLPHPNSVNVNAESRLYELAINNAGNIDAMLPVKEKAPVYPR
ncbi:hypothetical protein KoxyNG13_014260 [Klebsiella pasteurii]